ncbi:MAG: hypothetical protein ACREIC_01070 [Limisphaerales bacterium]
MENLKPGCARHEGPLWLLVLAFAAALLLCGCSHSRDRSGSGVYLTGVYEAQPPVFLNGPMSVLLTNGPGFTARVTIQGQSFSPRSSPKSGQLFSRGGKLFFAPAGNQTKQAKTGGFAFMWDVASSSGFVLSGALEAYAPVSSSVHPTNVVTETKPMGSVDGHPATLQNATVQMDDGTTATFDVWRATDLNGTHLRITSSGTGIPLSLALSDIRLAPPPEDVFARPEEFAKYSSPEALADEIIARQYNLHRKSSGGLEPMEPLYRQPR